MKIGALQNSYLNYNTGLHNKKSGVEKSNSNKISFGNLVFHTKDFEYEKEAFADIYKILGEQVIDEFFQNCSEIAGNNTVAIEISYKLEGESTESHSSPIIYIYEASPKGEIKEQITSLVVSTSSKIQFQQVKTIALGKIGQHFKDANAETFRQSLIAKYAPNAAINTKKE